MLPGRTCQLPELTRVQLLCLELAGVLLYSTLLYSPATLVMGEQKRWEVSGVMMKADIAADRPTVSFSALGQAKL